MSPEVLTLIPPKLISNLQAYALQRHRSSVSHGWRLADCQSRWYPGRRKQQECFGTDINASMRGLNPNHTADRM